MSHGERFVGLRRTAACRPLPTFYHADGGARVRSVLSKLAGIGYFRPAPIAPTVISSSLGP